MCVVCMCSWLSKCLDSFVFCTCFCVLVAMAIINLSYAAGRRVNVWIAVCFLDFFQMLVALAIVNIFLTAMLNVCR